MSIFRTYFEKNTTILYNNLSNTAKNEVFELLYGRNPKTHTRIFSRYFFKIDFTDLQKQLADGYITQNSIEKHTLRFYNCISIRSDLVGGQFPDDITFRASDFDLMLFEAPEEWSEGVGREYIYSTRVLPKTITTPANWKYRKEPDIEWTIPGGFSGNTSGSTVNVLSTIHFDRGDENIEVDITNYVNNILFSGGTNNGLGLAFVYEWENKDVFRRYGVSFFSKYTTTFYEPHLETHFNDYILDDRNEFYLDKENNLFLYSYIGGELKDLDNTPSSVDIYDEKNELYATIDDVERVRKGVYKINFSLSSQDHYDSVIYTDVWKGLIYNSVNIEDTKQFFTLLEPKNYYRLTDREQSNEADILFLPSNFVIQYNGIMDGERITRGDVRRVIIDIRNKAFQNNLIYVENLEYRIYVKQGLTEIEIIPFTKINKTNRYFFFDINTSWMIPNHYYVQVRIKRNNLVDTRKEILKFIIQNELE